MQNPPEEYDQIRTMLRIKRYEQPPPGYFNRFHTQVMARIEVEAQAKSSWLERFWMAFETRPALAASYGILVGGLVICGLVFTQNLEGTSTEGFSQFANSDPIGRLAIQPINDPAAGLQPSSSTANDFLFSGSSLTPQPLVRNVSFP